MVTLDNVVRKVIRTTLILNHPTLQRCPIIHVPPRNIFFGRYRSGTLPSSPALDRILHSGSFRPLGRDDDLEDDAVFRSETQVLNPFSSSILFAL